MRGQFEVSEVNDVTIVRFLERKIIDSARILEMGEQLTALVERDNRRRLLLDFSLVEFLSSAALNRLIVLEKKVKAAAGSLKLCNLLPQIQELFQITKLNQLFDIRSDRTEALAAF